MDGSIVSTGQNKVVSEEDFKSFATRTTTTTTTSSAKTNPLTFTTDSDVPSSCCLKEDSSHTKRHMEDIRPTDKDTSSNGDKVLSDDAFKSLSHDDLINYVSQLHAKVVGLEGERSQTIEMKDKLQDELLEATRRENLLVLKLASKEREMISMSGQLRDMKAACLPSV